MFTLILLSVWTLFNKPISEVKFKIKSKDQIDKLSNILNKDGDTRISIELENEENTLLFKLENPRKVDRKSLNLLKNKKIYSNII